MRGEVFVTPHAAKRYAERVEPCSHEDAISRIVEDISNRTSVRKGRDGCVIVTGPRPRRVRYHVSPPLPGHTLPAVVTVVTR